MIIDHLFTQPVFEAADPSKLIVSITVQPMSTGGEPETKEFDLTGMFQGSTASQMNQAMDYMSNWLESKGMAFNDVRVSYQGHTIGGTNRGAMSPQSDWEKEADAKAAQMRAQRRSRPLAQTSTPSVKEDAAMASPEQLAYNRLRAQYDSYQTMTGGGGNTAVSRDPAHAAKLATVPAELARMAAALKAKGIDAEAQYDALGGPKTAPVDANQAYGGVSEVAPPGARAERMVKHIKAGYARDGKLTPKEKGIAFATAWKAHNAGRVEEQDVAEGHKEKDPIWNKGTPMPKDYTCPCGIHVHPSVRKPGAIHTPDCPYAEKKKQGVADGSETAAEIDKEIEFHKLGQAAAQYKGWMNKMHAKKIRDLEAKKAALKQGVADDSDNTAVIYDNGYVKIDGKMYKAKRMNHESGMGIAIQTPSKMYFSTIQNEYEMPSVTIHRALKSGGLNPVFNEGVEAEKNPHTSALGRALYRDLSKQPKLSPQQVQRNKERWAQRQAEREQGVAEGQLAELKKSTVKSYADKKQAELDDVPPLPFKKPAMTSAEHERAAKGMMGALARLGGKKPTSEGAQGVAEGSVNDYFKRRKDEEDRIAGTKAPAKRTPKQTDYEKKRKEQGVAEGKTSTPAIYVKGGGKYPGMTIAPKGWTRITDIKDEGDSYFVMVGNDGDGLNIPKDKVSPHQIKLKNGMPITAKQAFMMFNGWTPDGEQGAADKLTRAAKDSHKKKDVKESDTLMLKLKRALVKEGRVKELADDLKTMSDADFMKKYGKAKAAIRKDMNKLDEATPAMPAAPAAPVAPTAPQSNRQYSKTYNAQTKTWTTNAPAAPVAPAQSAAPAPAPADDADEYNFDSWEQEGNTAVPIKNGVRQNLFKVPVNQVPPGAKITQMYTTYQQQGNMAVPVDANGALNVLGKIPLNQVPQGSKIVQNTEQGALAQNLPGTEPATPPVAAAKPVAAPVRPGAAKPVATAPAAKPVATAPAAKPVAAPVRPGAAKPVAAPVRPGAAAPVNELSTNKLAQYKTAAAKDATAADKAGDVKRGDKRFGGIVKATKKQFDNDAKKVEESRAARRALMAQIVKGN